jgi:hypothetical protein
MSSAPRRVGSTTQSGSCECADRTTIGFHRYFTHRGTVGHRPPQAPRPVGSAGRPALAARRSRRQRLGSAKRLCSCARQLALLNLGWSRDARTARTSTRIGWCVGSTASTPWSRRRRRRATVGGPSASAPAGTAICRPAPNGVRLLTGANGHAWVPRFLPDSTQWPATTWLKSWSSRSSPLP